MRRNNKYNFAPILCGYGLTVFILLDDLKEAVEKVIARSPSGAQATLSVEPNRVQQLAKNGRYNPIFELFYNVCGILPPLPNIDYATRDSLFADNWGGLRRAHAIFKGLKRPLATENRDSEIYVYVLSPRYVYEYEASMVCIAKRKEAPIGALFLVYVIFNDESLLHGTILNWEWVISAKSNTRLPKDYKSRYEEEVWINDNIE